MKTNPSQIPNKLKASKANFPASRTTLVPVPTLFATWSRKDGNGTLRLLYARNHAGNKLQSQDMPHANTPNPELEGGGLLTPYHDTLSGSDSNSGPRQAKYHFMVEEDQFGAKIVTRTPTISGFGMFQQFRE